MCYEFADPMLGSLIAFDLDGTLVDSRPEIAAAMKHAWESLLGDTAFPERGFRIGPPLAEIIASLAPQLDETQRTELANVFRARYDASDFSASPPYGGVVELIDELRGRGAHLGVATNKRRAPTLRILARWFHERFPHVACIDGVSPDDGTRPDGSASSHAIKAGMLTWLDRQKETAPAMILVGDTTNDIAAARAAGWRVVAVTWGYEDAEVLAAARPDQLVRDVAELRDALELLSASVPVA